MNKTIQDHTKKKKETLLKERTPIGITAFTWKQAHLLSLSLYLINLQLGLKYLSTGWAG